MNAGRRTVLNIDIEDTDLRSILHSFSHGTVFTANIDHFVLLQEDESFYRAY
ncbi:MAG: glycosyltransferase, partial [Bacteroidetes bacterium]|nr:glycosyltransferase [Bacteroidota bacterium]